MRFITLQLPDDACGHDVLDFGLHRCSLPRVRTTFCFFFQAEDGIRDLIVTGVQTCALPIWVRPRIARWKACECALAKPASTRPFSVRSPGSARTSRCTAVITPDSSCTRTPTTGAAPNQACSHHQLVTRTASRPPW